MIQLAAVLLSLAPAVPRDNEDPPIPADKEVVTTASGLKYSVLRPGTGTVHPGPNDKVTAHYNLWLENGKLVDSSHTRGTPFKTRVGNVIKGWQEGLALMTEGAVFKFTIPPELGYGSRDQGAIPPDSTLIFEVELLDVVAMPVFHEGNKEKQTKTESGLVYEPLREGSGTKPDEANVLKLAFAIWTPDGELQQCTEETERYWTFAHDDAPWPFLSEAMGFLTPGARFRFEVPAALIAPEGQEGGEGPDMVLELELVDMAAPLPVPEFALPKEPKKTDSGLEYEVIREGTGAQAEVGKTVEVHYAGWLTDGTPFDNSYERAFPIEFPLQPGRLIQGWIEGVPLMREGAIYRFKLPPELGYGARGAGETIGPDATLVFQIELLSVK